MRPLAFQFAGPALGGLLVGVWGPGSAFALNAATFLTMPLCWALLQLRNLYEAGTVSSVEVVLGARTLDDAMSNIEELNTATAANLALVAELRGAHGQLLRERRALAARAAALAAAHARAAATEAALAHTRAVRAAYVASLAREQRLSAARIARVQAQAHEAVVHTSQFQASRSIATRTVLDGTRLTVSTTAYSLPGYTSSGLHTGWGVVAVDPR